VGDGAADSTGKSEARVQSSTGGRVRRGQGSKLGLGGVDLAGAGGSGGRSGGHCEGRLNRRQRVEWRVVVLEVKMGDFKAQKVLLEKASRTAWRQLYAPTSSGQPTALALSNSALLLFPRANHVTAH